MRYVLFVVLSVLLLAMASSSMAATTWTVGPGGPPYDYATIQAAIGAGTTLDGDTIQVAAGTYTETGQIVINKNLTIIGAGAGSTTIKTDTNTTAGGNVQSEAWIYVAPSVTCRIAYVTLDGSGKQVHHAVQSRGDLTIEYCTIQNVRYSQYLGRSIVLYSGTSYVRYCTFQNIERIGVHVRGNVVSPNPVATIVGCDYTGKGPIDCLDYAYEVGGGGQVTIINSKARACRGIATDGSTSAGILATDYWGTGTQATVAGCTISDCSDGIACGYATNDATVANIYYCDLSGNDAGLTNVSTVTGLITAEKNYWGTNSDPGTAYAGTNVDYTPWAVKTTVSTTIQAAISAAANGDIIEVPAGTYVETGQIVINKDLTITGAGAANTTIKPATDTGGSGDARGWFLVNAGKSLKLTDVTLDGDSPTRKVHTAIRSNGSVDIEDCVIKNVAYTPSSYDGRGIGPYAGSNLIRNVVFSNIYRIGVLTFGSGVFADIMNCTYTGKGYGDWLDYGFEFGGGGQGVLLNNSISKCTGVAYDGSTSAGVLVTTYFDPGTAVEMVGNTITQCTTGVAVGYDSADTSAVFAQSNNLTGNGEGASMTSTLGSVVFGSNWWGTSDGPGPLGSGSGDRVGSNVDYSSWLTKAAGANALYLEATPDSVYVKSGQTVTVDLKQANMSVGVAGYQAFLNFDTGMLGSPTATWATGTPYEWPILNNITGGDINLAAGTVTSGGTTANADLVRLQFTAGSTQGLTQIVFRSHDPATQFTDTLGIGNGVAATTVNSSNIYIDSDAPTGVSISAVPASWTNASSVTLTFSATDTLSGIDHYELSIDSGLYFTATSPYVLDVSSMSDGTHTATVKAVDRAGNEATASTNFYLDKMSPSISIDSAKQSSVELISGGTAIQGVVNIQVTASDATSGLNGHPAVTVTPNGGSAEAATYVNESPTGTFNYTWTVDETTPNGTATINATVSDNAANPASAASKTFNVNKTQAVVTVELEGVTTSLNRWIKFVIGGTGGPAGPLTITRQVSFVGGSATVTFTDLSNAGQWTRISAKDEQHTLQKQVALTNGGNLQYSASLILIGGDVTNDNMVDILDFGVFAGQYGTSPLLDTTWSTRNANISCAGTPGVGTDDFTYIQQKFLSVGDTAPSGAAFSMSVGGGSTAGPSPRASISVKELSQIIGMKDAQKADVNNDKVVDAVDMQLFYEKHIKGKNK